MQTSLQQEASSTDGPFGYREIDLGSPAASLAEPVAGQPKPQSCWWRLVLTAGDALACVALWFFLSRAPALAVWVAFAALGLSAVIWRVLLHGFRSAAAQWHGLPYTCGYATSGGKEVFVVSTLHISPRSLEDVRVVLNTIRPDAVMIELDEERLADMRGSTRRRPQLQVLQITKPGQQAASVHTQRAVWNAEQGGQRIEGGIVIDEADKFCMSPPQVDVKDRLILVSRGAPEGQSGPFALKAHMAARAGAKAVLVVNSEGALPAHTLGVGSLRSDLQIAWRTRSMGFPPIPLLLLPHADGEELRSDVRRCGPGAVHGDFMVMEDNQPRQTLRRRLCQTIALALSGIVVLYGVIECLKVDAGDEFLVAYEEAERLRVPCLCIDVDMNRLCSRLAATAAPTPRNILRAVLSWLALPRVLLRACFPSKEDVDLAGTTVLHFLSFRLRTWIAFIVAGACAGCLVGFLLMLVGRGAEGAAEHSGVVKPRDRDEAWTFIVLLLELYLLPCLYEAVASSRDEAMFQSLQAKAASAPNFRRLVLVVGAAHANGLLQRVRSRGV